MRAPAIWGGNGWLYEGGLFCTESLCLQTKFGDQWWDHGTSKRRTPCPKTEGAEPRYLPSEAYSSIPQMWVLSKGLPELLPNCLKPFGLLFHHFFLTNNIYHGLKAHLLQKRGPGEALWAWFASSFIVSIILSCTWRAHWLCMAGTALVHFVSMILVHSFITYSSIIYYVSRTVLCYREI